MLMIAVRAAIHARLMTPRANPESMSAQQQPTQKAPCESPIFNAPPGPFRQCVRK